MRGYLGYICEGSYAACSRERKEKANKARQHATRKTARNEGQRKEGKREEEGEEREEGRENQTWRTGFPGEEREGRRDVMLRERRLAIASCPCATPRYSPKSNTRKRSPGAKIALTLCVFCVFDFGV